MLDTIETLRSFMFSMVSLTRMIFATLCVVGVFVLTSCGTLSSRQSESTATRVSRTDRLAAEERYITDLYIKAVGAYTLERYEQAIEFLRRCNSLLPSYATYLLTAKCFQSLASIDSALVYDRRALLLNDSCDECWTVLGDLEFSKNVWSEAASAYRRAMELRPSPGASYRYASALSRFDRQSAIIVYEGLYHETQNAALLFELSSLYEDIGDSSNSYKTIERIIADLPQDGFPLESYLDVLIKGKQYGTVLNVLDNALTRSNNQTDIDLTPAEMLKRVSIEMYSHAEKCDSISVGKLFELAQRTEPKDVNLLEICGLLFHGKSLLRQADSAFTLACDVDTGFGSVYRITSFFYELGDTARVCSILTRNEKRNRSSYQISLLCGMMYDWCKSFQRAIDWYRHASSLSPDSEEPLMYMAGLYDKIGRTKESQSTYELLISKRADNDLALNNVAYSYACTGRNLVKALSYIKKALLLQPGKPSYLDTYGWVLHKMKRYNEANGVLTHVVGIEENNPTFFEHMGDNSQKLGLRDRAFAAWNRAFELDSSRTYLRSHLKLRK